jgi:hypothetical protein
VALDALLADYLLLHDDADPATVTLTDLAKWSRSRTIRAAELAVGAGPARPAWDKEWSPPSLDGLRVSEEPRLTTAS